MSEPVGEVRKPVLDRTQLPPKGRGLSAWIGRTFLRAFDWEVEGGVPNAPKAVLVAAPHTSNWDLPFSLAVAWVLGVRIRWMGKHTIFRFPFGSLMKALGGIPVDRRKSHNAVAAAVSILDEADELILMIPPEGTRSVAKRWKTGFYYTAVGAKVPIVLGFLDFGRKRGGIGTLLYPTGDIETDIVSIREFYAGMKGKHPDLMGEITVQKSER